MQQSKNYVMHNKTALSLVLIPIIIFKFNISLSANIPVYNSNNKENKKIALTFDDGPHPRNTPKILDILERNEVKATFFVIGINAKNYPETLSMVVDKGHEIGNHTYSHQVLKSKNKEEIYKEIIDTEKEISKENVCTKLIRPPCGLYDKNLIDIALENEYKIVLWNIDTNDWMHMSQANIVSEVISKIKGGDIILFHDYISGENNTPDALQVIIPKLKSMGYEFVTVTELLQNV